MRSKTLLLSGAFALLACGHTAEPPPLQTVRFDRWVATYRAYTQGDICDAEPRWLFDELTSVNGALNGFLDAVTPPEGERPGSRRLKLLEEAPQDLRKVIDDHLTNVSLARGCAFAEKRGFPVVLERGAALAADAREVMARAPEILRYERALLALEQWRKDRQRAELTGKLACPNRIPRRGPPLYHAYQDEAGRITWMFCDGSRVVDDGSKPAYEAGGELTRQKPAYYLDTARGFSRERISRPPEVPKPASSIVRRSAAET